MAKIKIGDLVRVKLLNDMYMWVHVLFDSQFIVKGKKEINPYNYFYFYASCYLVNIYSQISTEEELKDDTIFFKGVFIPRKHVAKETIISNIPVDYRQIDFPEHTGGFANIHKQKLIIVFFSSKAFMRVTKMPIFTL